MTGITIYGAGMAGLLAAHMLRRFEPIVFEAQPSLPNNHEALLRFRSDAVSKATGIPFQKVRVHKAIWFKNDLYNETNLKFNNMYANKVTGRTIARSILSLDPVDRYIAPPDFIRQLSVGVNIQYNHRLESLLTCGAEPAISTIPMPMMMEMSGWDVVPEFCYKTIHTISMELEDVDVYQTIYYPHWDDIPYRASITGNKLMIEVIGDTISHDADWQENFCHQVLGHFGVSVNDFTGPKLSSQKYGKIVPIDDQARKTFILALTDKHNIYSLGRFATWRQLLLDDVVDDVKFIEQCIIQRDIYAGRIWNR